LRITGKESGSRRGNATVVLVVAGAVAAAAAAGMPRQFHVTTGISPHDFFPPLMLVGLFAGVVVGFVATESYVFSLPLPLLHGDGV
jgi:hypothetical protein